MTGLLGREDEVAVRRDGQGWAAADDRALLDGLHRRQVPAVAEVYRRHGADLLVAAHLLVGGPLAAEAAVVDAFADLWQRPPPLDGQPVRLHAQLAAGVHRRALDAARAAPADASPRPQSGPPGQPPTPVEQLSADQRAALALTAFGGHTYHQAAQVLGVAGRVLADQLGAALHHLRSLGHRRSSDGPVAGHRVTDTAVPAAVHDPRRLAAVRASGLVDSPPEEAFDRLSRLVALLLDAPRAFVTVVDTERSWYKSCVGLPAAAERSGPVEASFCQYVVGSGEPLVVPDARLDPLTCDNPAIETMGVIAWAGFPVWAPGGEVLGTLCAADTRRHAWTERDVAVLEMLASAASGEIALRHALGQEHQARARAEALARTLQESLLPPGLPDVPGVEVAARYRPAGTGAEVGGDFYDLFPLGRSSWGVVLGDVTGKGAGAARVTALARYTVRAAAVADEAPGRVLGTLNAALARQHQAGPPDEPRFLTAVFATVRTAGERVRLTVANGGHPPPLVLRAGGQVEAVDGAGALLGAFPQPDVGDHPVELWPGDTVVLYTDGVTEARAGRAEYGPERLRALLADSAGLDAEALVARIEGDVARFQGDAFHDDLAVLALRAADPDRGPGTGDLDGADRR